ncbi:EamA domain-containing membrane protein RarD [Tenacibaculum sp. MAR_2010_89]|uniref:DMT family transporter n=1 Tax=Tenacibaculum sp. MAR_2010_89 TaxID=1250198 RepID=UPI00089C3A82|nr:DMT family transporter [Tenacibaculum sp. MAR_2010_89]SEE55213.1 EamA domain-containing membrane protein RarD [Tenacibaculum sp. MAR_2010_89]
MKLSGVFLGVLGIVMFSSKAVMVKMAYQYNVSSIHLLLFRMLFSLPFYIIILLLDNRKREVKVILKNKDYLWLFFFGFIGYYLASYFDFLGLQYIEASLERIILFVYPTLVLLINRLFFKEKVTKHQVWAILLTYIGVVLAFGSGSQVFDYTLLLGGVLVFLSALTYASYLVGSGWLIPRFGVKTFTSYAMIVSTICVVIHYLLVDRTSIFIYPKEVYYLGFLMAIIATLIPSFLVSYAIQKIGASNFSILGSIGPFSTIVLAIIFLNESMSFWQFIGAIIVVVGVRIVVKKNKGNS